DSALRGEVEFRNLTFAYPTTVSGVNGSNGSNGSGKSSGGGPHAVLSDINLKIPAGSTLAVVGPTGCGKTTLAALVARLWEAPEGTVLIDGHPIQHWPLETLRRSIGYVPQDTYLFTETVGGNIAFGLPNYNAERCREAAEIASLHGDIQDFAGGYDTAVGERGITLSGGQKQRTAIARAIVRDPRILILDDALSSVDTQTEEKILSGLRGVMRGRTTILISHRTSTVQNADQIVVLRAGNELPHARSLRLGRHPLTVFDLLGRARVRFTRPVHPDPHHAACRPGNHVRHAPRNFLPSAAFGHELLRPQPRRRPGHSRHHRRRRPERPLRCRRGHHDQRFLPPCSHGRAAFQD